MRLLVLSFYFEPDLSAGSFRTTALVKAMLERAPAGTEFDVLTTAPNRYRSYVRSAANFEVSGSVQIRRVRLPAHQNDMVGQARAFMHFARVVRAHVAGRTYDLVYATSSRLMTASLGAWVARRKSAALYLDIRDIFADSIGDVMPWPAGGFLRAAFARLEGWTVRRADHINLVSPGFEPYFRSRYGSRRYGAFTNGIDEEFLDAACKIAPDSKSAAIVTVLYAGNIGEGQGLHYIIPELAKGLHGRARFVIIGDGGRRRALEQAIEKAGVDNVELRDPVERGALLEAYRAADVLLMHLGRLAAFEKVLPSKVFEYAALGKPILAGVGGYAATFVEQEISNAAVFPPGDAAAAIAAFERLTIQDQARPDFVTKFARPRIMNAMADEVMQLAARRHEQAG